MGSSCLLVELYAALTAVMMVGRLLILAVCRSDALELQQLGSSVALSRVVGALVGERGSLLM